MKPSFTPWRFSKASLYWLRSAITALMSTSLKVVSMAAVVLRLLQAPGDGLAQAGHPHPLLALLRRTRRGGGPAQALAGGGRWGCCGAALPARRGRRPW